MTFIFFFFTLLHACTFIGRVNFIGIYWTCDDDSADLTGPPENETVNRYCVLANAVAKNRSAAPLGDREKKMKKKKKIAKE